MTGDEMEKGGNGSGREASDQIHGSKTTFAKNMQNFKFCEAKFN